MILYFCSKIIDENLTLDFRDIGYYYPVIYPKKEIQFESKKDVLFKTIQSYSSISFSKVVFRIDFENEKEKNQKDLINLIYTIWPKEIVDINFSRPSSVNEWLEECIYLNTKYEINTPVLVAMNHDHPYVDYNSNIFKKVVDLVFDKSKTNLNKALYYSHAPEVIKWINLGRGNCKFKTFENNLFVSNKENKWVDSIVVITFETFYQIWKSISYKGNYIGRFDWKDVKFINLEIEFYAFPREFFRHFDGYGHTTGVRMNTILKLDSNSPLVFPSETQIQGLINFYYQLWIDNFIYFIEAAIEESFFSLKSRKSIFIEIVQKSIFQFEKAYLELDTQYGLLTETQKKKILIGLHNIIYYNGNDIYNQMSINIKLKSNWLKTPLFRFKALIVNFLKRK